MEDRLLYLLSRAQHRLKNHLKREFASAGVGVSPAQMGILFLLKQRDARPMNELGRMLDIDNSAITGLVDRMERQGLVRRTPNPEDRRQSPIAITRQGMDEAARAAKVARKTNEAIREGFSPEDVAVFVRILSAFFDKFR
ncbi:MAG TPA: MarR family transcriptional regulator [Spirochaetota bacterium]|nr:MarR family transcriptional regulator [Spirochaetota bacterium]